MLSRGVMPPKRHLHQQQYPRNQQTELRHAACHGRHEVPIDVVPKRCDMAMARNSPTEP